MVDDANSEDKTGGTINNVQGYSVRFEADKIRAYKGDTNYIFTYAEDAITLITPEGFPVIVYKRV